MSPRVSVPRAHPAPTRIFLATIAQISIFIALFAHPSSFARAQSSDAPPPPRTLDAHPRGEAPITIDGRLDEAPWQSATASAGFVERTPIPGAAPPVITTLRVLYDDDALYVGLEMGLLPGERPRALELRRDDFGIFDDDAVSVKIDVRHDHRNTVGFVTNPEGAQLDYVAIDNGRSFRREFDAVWEVATTVEPTRWTAEFRLPAAALGLPPGTGERVLGLQISRDHNARLATDDWAPMPPEMGAFSALHYGELHGVRGLGGGRPLVLIPFALGRYRRDAEGDGFTPALGGEVRLRVADDVWAEATVLTDFAEVDLDDQRVNLDRFPLFFPERRPFFLSGIDVFEFGEPGVAQLFFTRRIGLDANGGAIPILAGVKSFGRVGRTAFGVLDVLTDGTPDQPAANHGVVRVRQNLGDSSYVGAMFGSRAFVPLGGDAPATDGAEPHYAAGADALVRLADERLELSGFASYTAREAPPPSAESPFGAPSTGSAGRLAVKYRGKLLQPELSTLFVSRDFRPELGFVRRRDIVQTRLNVPFIHRVLTRWLRSWSGGLGGTLIASEDLSRRVGSKGSWDLGLTTLGGWDVAVGADYEEDVVDAPFTLLPGLEVAAGTYRGATLRAFASAPTGRNPTASAYYELSNAFFGGTQHYLSTDASVSFGSHVKLAQSLVVAWIALPGAAPTQTLTLNGSLTVAPSPRLAFDLIGQFNSVSETAVAMLRARWRFLPGSDLFFVWREALDVAGRLAERERSLTLKASLRLDLVL